MNYDDISYLEQLFKISFSEQEVEILLLNLQVRTFKKNSFPIRQNDTLTNLFLVRKGLVRGIYTDEDGNEITKCFSSEGCFFSAEGLLQNRTASFDIECLEDVVCIQIPYLVIAKLRQDNPSIGDLFQLILVKEFLESEKRSKNVLLLDATTRYQCFLKDYPELSSRIKQKYIASYLGISPVSLSRLRAKLT